MDASCALCGLVVLSPAFLLTALAIRLTSRGPAFFRQTRVGRYGKRFRIFKFRTMRTENEEAGSLLTAAGDPRVTTLGRWLRRTKMDELPQLINVLAGQMSLVGPRPEVPKFVATFTESQRRILAAKPGITGPCANIYLNEEELLAGQPDDEQYYISKILPAKIDIDIAYCEQIRFVEDLRIIFQTFAKVFGRVVELNSPCAVTSKSRFRTSKHAKSVGSAIEVSARGTNRPMKIPACLYSRTCQVILDAGSFAISFVAAYVIRLESWPAGPELRQLLLWLPILISARLIAHFLLGIYRHIWKFVSFPDAIEVAKSIAIVSAALAALRFVVPGHTAFSEWIRIPVSVIALEGLLSLTSSMGIRALRRLLYSFQKRAAAASGQPAKRVLLYGAGRAGIMVLKELETNDCYDVIGFVDDDPRKMGRTNSKTCVVGNGDHLAQLVAKYRADEIIICMATASRQTLARTLSKCRRAGVPAKIIPSVLEMLGGNVPITQLRETRVEDILGRESVDVPDFERIAGSAYRGKCVLVTGAGGSIGSELVRQLLRLDPSRIVILDKDENSVYELDQELLLRGSCVPIEPHIADVRDLSRLRSIFSELRPQVVFHAAAHKHVPLMEKDPCEAVLNNVCGTKNVLEIAAEHGIERFVFISSDKAVNPVNVMGATKRIGELLVQSSVEGGGLRCACVRFGNVLGSRGSVLPLFQKQIAAGGPVTVTHPDMTRYFMTIQEAVQLVLCAGTMATVGEIFVLDMGAPRNIMEFARELIVLSGLEPGIDIQTSITGLRPGEKIFEELVGPFEELRRTRFEKLSVIEPKLCDKGAFLADLSRLVQAAACHDASRVSSILGAMGLGYRQQVAKARAAVA